MTNENTDSDDAARRADSGRSQNEKRRATVLRRSPPNDPDVYLVEYPDGSTDYEPATATNRALFEDGLYDAVNGNTAFNFEDGRMLESRNDINAGEFRLFMENVPVQVPSGREMDVIRAFEKDSRSATRDALADLYDELTEGQVRRHAVQKFIDLFPDGRVEFTADGWVVDDTFIVDWDAENHLVHIDPTDPQGDEVDSSKQAVYLNLDADGASVETAPSGDRVQLSAVEQEFLTTVELLLFPEDYLDVELVDEVEQKRAAGAMKNRFSELAGTATATGFTDSKTGIHHGSTSHGFEKHRLSDLGVTDEATEKLYYHDYDHTGVWEMLQRRREFENAPFEVFEDADNDDPDKWAKIESTAEKAPIPSSVRSEMESMFGAA